MFVRRAARYRAGAQRRADGQFVDPPPMLGPACGQGRGVRCALIVTVALRRKQPVCSGCGARGLPIKDHRVKRWRHLDARGLRCVIECRLRRLYCPGCGELPEHVEWARGGARYTRDFDDLCAWLAQQMNQTQVTRLMRIGWETVGNILERVVAESSPPAGWTRLS